MRRLIVFILCIVFSCTSFSEDLLGESDDFLLEEGMSFESELQGNSNESNKDFIDELVSASTFSFANDLMQSKRIDLLRTSAEYNFEKSVFDDLFIKFTGQYEFIHSSDYLARQNNNAYSDTDINEFWAQYSRENCNVKLGKQTLFWGSVEGAYAVDVISPLDITQPLLTDFSAIRQAQNMLITNCYGALGNIEFVWVAEPKILKASDKNLELQHTLYKQLHDEYAIRYRNSFSSGELHLMYARLYKNNPSINIEPLTGQAELVAPRTHMYGMSAVWALDQLLLEVDLAYKTNKLVSASYLNTSRINTKDSPEIAIGFEYLSNSNHQFSGGVYAFKNRALTNIAGKAKWEQNYNFAWSKEYLNDTLSLSLLSGWQTLNQNIFNAIQANYEWNDYWQSTVALIYNSQYQDNGEISQTSDKSSLFLSTKITY